MSYLPHITYGMIVLNGEPFIKYNLRSIYPYAHQIIIVEGATEAASSISTIDGHSRDGTLETIRYFKSHEDPDNKLMIITAEDEGHPNGFWSGEKHEMSQAYAKRATGDYLWQIDVDEFYKPEDIEMILEMLRKDPQITAMSFKILTFWGGFDYITDGWYLRRGADIYYRLFKWDKGYRYITHRPPTVLNSEEMDLRNIKMVTGHQLSKKGILLYHYSLVFTKQVFEKCEYYKQAKWAKRNRAILWAKDIFLGLKNPYRVHNVYDYPSWLEIYRGKHPDAVMKLISDIKNFQVDVELRPSEDTKKLMVSFKYRVGRILVMLADYPDRFFTRFSKILLKLIGQLSSHFSYPPK